jgi:hypothetical protein
MAAAWGTGTSQKIVAKSRSFSNFANSNTHSQLLKK